MHGKSIELFLANGVTDTSLENNLVKAKLDARRECE